MFLPPQDVTPVTSTFHSTQQGSFEIADVNNDGYLDLVYTREQGCAECGTVGVRLGGPSGFGGVQYLVQSYDLPCIDSAVVPQPFPNPPKTYLLLGMHVLGGVEFGAWDFNLPPEEAWEVGAWHGTPYFSANSPVLIDCEFTSAGIGGHWPQQIVYTQAAGNGWNFLRLPNLTNSWTASTTISLPGAETITNRGAGFFVGRSTTVPGRYFTVDPTGTPQAGFQPPSGAPLLRGSGQYNFMVGSPKWWFFDKNNASGFATSYDEFGMTKFVETPVPANDGGVIQRFRKTEVSIATGSQAGGIFLYTAEPPYTQIAATPVGYTSRVRSPVAVDINYDGMLDTLWIDEGTNRIVEWVRAPCVVDNDCTGPSDYCYLGTCLSNCTSDLQCMGRVDGYLGAVDVPIPGQCYMPFNQCIPPCAMDTSVCPLNTHCNLTLDKCIDDCNLDLDCDAAGLVNHYCTGPGGTCEPSCSDDSDCTIGACLFGRCENPCDSQIDCPAGSQCSLIEGQCRPLCTSNEECAMGSKCGNDGVCQDLEIVQTIPPSSKIIPADLNVDGAIDFLAVRTDIAAPSIYAMHSDGGNPVDFVPTLVTNTAFITGSSYSDVTVGDCDRDGKPDILIGLTVPIGIPNAEVVTLRSTEYDEFTSTYDVLNAGRTPIGSLGVRSLHTADFDGDGNLDLAVMPSSGLIEVYQGDGNCNFALRWTSGQNFSNSPMVVGNVDGFAGSELVVGQGNNLYVYQFDRNTWSFGLAFAPMSNVAFAGSSMLKLGNLHGNGNLEINVVLSDRTLTYLYDPLLDPSGLQYQGIINEGGAIAAIGNLAGDRRNELVLGGLTSLTFGLRFSTLGLYDSISDFVEHIYTQTPISFSDVSVVDVTGDRRSDIIALRSDGLGLMVFPGKADVFGAPEDLGGATRDFQDIKLTDVDRDGGLDLYFLASGSTYYGWRAGPTFAADTGSSILENYEHFAIADLNSDGRMDVVYFSSIAGQKSHRAMGTGTGFGPWEALLFDRTEVAGTDVVRSTGVVGTFDASGRPEFFVGNAAGGNYLLRYDAGVLRELNATSSWTGATAARTLTAAAGDITGNGLSDVVIGGVHATVQTARWLRSDGGGNFFNENLPNLSMAKQTGVALADFNNDGKLDIVYAQENAPNVVLLQGAGNLFSTIDWQSPPHLPNTEQTTDVTAMDLNSDGYPDLIFSATDGDAVQIYFNNADPANFGFYSAQVFPGGEWEATAVGDVDNDGDLDLIVAPSDGTLHILQNLIYVEPGTDDEGLLTNQPTTAVVYRPGSPMNFEDGGAGRPVNGLVEVPVLLRDAESDFANLIMEYRAVGSSTWVEFAEELRLAATPVGVTHLIDWDTTGFPVGEYELRATVIQTPTVGMTAIGSTLSLSPTVRVGGCLGGCPVGEVCVGVSCEPSCTDSTECSPGELCYGESFCAPADPEDAEDATDCPPGYEADGVDCVPTCIDNADCTAPDICFPSGCADPADLCANVTCVEDFVCLGGQCVLDTECLSNADCPGSDPVCYVAASGAGACGPADPCELVECPGVGYTCAFGSCFSVPACEPPLIEFPGLGCALPPGAGACDGVICSINEVCIVGGAAGLSCEPACDVDADCLEPGDVCYNSEFCGPTNLCGGLVECPPGFGCSEGGCYPICNTEEDCEDPLLCNDNLCRDGNDPCDGIFCSEGNACYLGACFPTCDDSGDCNPPLTYCFDSTVCLQSYDLCEGLICPFGTACHQGQCIISCSEDDPCVAPYACYSSICAENDCDVTCPDQMACYQQGCHTVCGTDEDCAYADQCHTSLIAPVGPDRCAVDPCGDVFCLLDETCFGGTCAPICGPGGTCEDPNHVCYNNEACLPMDPCEGVYCPVGQTCFGGDCRLACSLNGDCPGFVGSERFIEVAEQVGLATPWSKNAGVSWGDFNNDGCLDLALNTSSSDGRSRLYQSDCAANPMFTDISHTVLPIDSGKSHFLKYGRERSIVWGDFNNDGYLDLARNTNQVISIYENQGPPSYALESRHAYTISAGGVGSFRMAMNTEGMGWIDYNGDGWLDLFAEDEEYGVLMYRNSRDGDFDRVDVSGLIYPGLYDRNGDYCAVAAINSDRHVDILCRKPNHGAILASDLFLNRGNGTFDNTGGALFNQPADNGNKGGATICDINNDGRFDIIWTDHGTNQIWLQNSSGVFSPTGEPAASSGYSFPARMNDVLCGDVDHDGRQDLFWIGEGESVLFLNRSDGSTLDFVVKSMGIDSTANAVSGAMADYNRDGSLDILIHGQPRNELWENPRDDDRYLMIRALVDLEDLVGAPANTVRDAIGAKVIIQSVDDEILGMREVNGGRGRGSQDPAVMHFGLPYGSNVPYKLTVVWPHGPRVTRCVVPRDIAGYQLVEIKDTDANNEVLCTTAGDWKDRIELLERPAESGEYCFAGTCAGDACAGVTCLKGSTCYGGLCEPDCSMCSSPNICVDDACVPDLCNDGDFVCPVGYSCTNGECEPECEEDSECGADEQCYQGTCNPETCDSVVCPAGQNCHKGICFDDCSACADPNICVDGRCVPNHCAALDDDFNDNYIFRKAGGHVSATRHSLPWFWPDPFVGSSFATWAGLSGNSVTNTDVPAPHTARVSLYLDTTYTSSHPQGRYILWFNQGAADGAQRPAQASYRVRVDGLEPQLVLDDDNNGESWDIIDTDMDDYYVFQAHVTSGSGETGGVAIGRFGSSDSTPWVISIDADFAGDIRRWEWVNADGTIIELDPKETLTLAISSPDGKYYSPAAGRSCATGLHGICQRGTSYCAQGERRCTPTVLPWAFEVCDGIDNTCNGQIDEPENLRFPGVEWRDDATSWQILTTMDKPQSVQSSVNFVAEGVDDRVGSTNLVSSDGTPIQAWDRAVIAMHRDLTTGSLSLLIASGLRESGGHLNGIGDYDVETRLSFPGDHTAEELFPAWWDDRQPAGNGDEITEDFHLNRMDFEWELRQEGSGASAWREADTVAMMTRWSGATQSLRELETRYRWTKHDNNSSAPRHLKFGIHQPGQDFRNISRTRTVQLRVTPQRQAETACWANGLTTVGGCGFGYYQCGLGGVISCGDPTDGACDRCVDGDGDGYAAYDEITCPTGRDCDDSDATIHPGAHEQCNGRDNDCDGLIDIKDDQEYFDRWGEVRPSGAASCPVGADNCGPQECQFRNVCVCPDGPEDPADPPSEPCYCGEGLAVPDDESAVCTMP